MRISSNLNFGFRFLDFFMKVWKLYNSDDMKKYTIKDYHNGFAMIRTLNIIQFHIKLYQYR